MIKINANLILRNTSIRAITLWFFVLIRDEKDFKDRVLITHERIHIRQQWGMLVLPFFLWYVVEYLIRYIQYKDWDKAYRNISFEREAYANEDNLNYLKNRKFWAWVKYM